MKPYLPITLGCALILFGCTQQGNQDVAEPVPSEAIIKVLNEQSIVHFAPGGLADKGLVKSPAEGIAVDNKISHKFIAPDDATLLDACEQTYRAALDDGWTGPGLADRTSNGIVSTQLHKGEMDLKIACVTSRTFDLLDNDKDEIRLTVRISTGSTSDLSATHGSD